MILDSATITQLEYELIEAIKTSDVNWLENILHDELQFLLPNGSVITKSMDLDAHRARRMKVETLTPVIEQITIIDDCAVVVVVYDTKGTMMGTTISGKFRYLRVWKKFNNLIQVIGGSVCQLS